MAAPPRTELSPVVLEVIEGSVRSAELEIERRIVADVIAMATLPARSEIAATRFRQAQLRAAGYERITTEILPAGEFFYAEDYHQQYLAKNPDGYCGLGGTGVSCPR